MIVAHPSSMYLQVFADEMIMPTVHLGRGENLWLMSQVKSLFNELTAWLLIGSSHSYAANQK